MPTGIMPEAMEVAACDDADNCPFDDAKWYEGVWGDQLKTDSERHQVQKLIKHERLPAGVTVLRDSTYKLR
jgi:mannosyl-oligosaccharide alpha-1,2-mannosidase